MSAKISEGRPVARQSQNETEKEVAAYGMEEPKLDLAPLCQVLNEYKTQKGVLIPILQKAQDIYGWLPQEVLKTIAKGLNVPLSQIYGVVTFYSQFSLQRRGRHVIRQCDGTACHVRGAAKIVDVVEGSLRIKAGETTPDYGCTYEVVYCLGSCGLAPVAMIDDHVVGHLVPKKMLEIVNDLVRGEPDAETHIP